MPMYNLTEYNYAKTSGSLWQYYRLEQFLDGNAAIADFPADNDNSASFQFKIKIVDRIENNNEKDVKIMLPLKYLTNFWRSLEMTLTNCEINLLLTWSEYYFIIDAFVENQVTTFTVTDTNNNTKKLQQLKSGFKRTTTWNKYQSEVTVQERDRYLDY